MTGEVVPRAGISSGLVGADDTLPSPGRWNHLAEIKAVVGTCRCGGPMQALPVAEPVSGPPQLEAHCIVCGKELVAPNGRVLRRSSLHAEMPAGWLEHRADRDREAREAREGNDPDGYTRR